MSIKRIARLLYVRLRKKKLFLMKILLKILKLYHKSILCYCNKLLHTYITDSMLIYPFSLEND